MNVLEERAQIRKSAESEAEELVLGSMHELNGADSGTETEEAVSKLNAMSGAYAQIVEGHKHEHDVQKILLNSAAAAGVGVIVSWVSDSRIFPKAAETAMRMVRNRV